MREGFFDGGKRMEGNRKTTIMDGETMQRTLKRIAHQIIENTEGAKDLVFIGIARRGVTIAQRIAGYIHEFEGVTIPIGTLDITFTVTILRMAPISPLWVRQTLYLMSTAKKSSCSTTCFIQDGQRVRQWTRSWTWGGRTLSSLRYWLTGDTANSRFVLTLSGKMYRRQH